MKIYYAHHLWKYGTEIEAWELDLVRQYFPGCEIVNPNGAIEQGRPSEDIMTDCLQKVRESDALVFSTLSGVIGKGVFHELVEAANLGLPIYCIQQGVIFKANNMRLELLKPPPSDRHFAVIFQDGRLLDYEIELHRQH